MTNQWPALLVENGVQAGQCFPLRTDTLSIGRNPECDIRLDSANVSREHLRISRQGDGLVAWDPGSANGTYVNGTRLTGTSVLKPGDSLRLGDMQLRYVVFGAAAEGEPPPSRTNRFADVSGSVNTGDPANHGGEQIVGNGRIYHGNVHHGDRVDVDFDQSFTELFLGRGWGRLLMAIGLVIAFTGFGIWMSIIFSGMPDGGSTESPFSSEILGLNKPVVGFSMFAVGGLMANLGASMSKAARKREERKHWS
jgi:hypothetical protein